MKTATYNLIKKRYIKELSKKDEILKLEGMKSVQRYLVLINLSKIDLPSNDIIMNRILNYADIDEDDSYKIVLDRGPYAIYNEDTIFERKVLITKEEIHRINTGFVREYFDLTTGKNVYSEENTIILLPTLERIIDGSKEYDRAKELLDYRACNLARAYFFIRLVSDGINKTLDFYKDKNNYEQIEDEILLIKKN